MKKKRSFIFILLIALMCILVWQFKKQPTDSKEQLPVSPETAQNLPLTNSEPRSQSTTHQSTVEEARAQMQERFREKERANERANDEWRRPIEFYGKVVDENNMAIEGAQINFSCNDLSSAGTSYYSAVSDANGLFSIGQIKGKLLVVGVSKKGYYTSKQDNDSFYYAGQNVNFVADSSNPVIFHLRKKRQAEPMVGVDFPGFAKIAKLPRNGGPIELDLIKGLKTQPDNGHIKLEFSGEKIEKTTRQFDWKLHISVPNGGLVRTDEEFNFQAPEEGYESAIEIDMPVSKDGWYSTLKHKYFIRLPSGDYGRIELMFMARNGVFTIQSFINPSGSRNLEYDEAVQPKQTVFE